MIHHPVIAVTQRAIRIYETAYGDLGHPNLAASLSNLGIIYVEAGRIEEGRSCLQRALRIFERAMPAGDAVVGNLRATLEELEEMAA